MKKSLSLLVAIAMVFSMFASVAAAATDAQGKYDVLKEAGIFTGFPDGSAGLDKQMTRAEFAAVIARAMKLETTAKASFADVRTAYWASEEIAAVAKAGYMEGVGANKFNPTAQVSVEQMATIAARLVGLEKSDAAVEGQVSGWAKGWVAAAVEAKLIPASTNYTAIATRGQLANATFAVVSEIGALISVTGYKVVDAKNVEVSFSDNETEKVALTEALKVGDNTIKVTHKGKEYSVTVKFEQLAATVKAAGAKKLEVAFNQAVDTAKANISIKRGSNSVGIASTTWSADKKTATVELSSKMVAGTYDVTVTGLDQTAATASVTVEAETVKAIEILSDFGALVDGTDADLIANDAIEVGYKVTNQYGEDITAITTLNASTSGASVGLTESTGTAKIQAAATFAIDNVVSLTLIHPGTATVASKSLKVSGEAKVAEIAVTELYHADKKALTADSTATEYSLVVEAKDQYGRAVTDQAKLDAEVIVSVTNPAVVSVNSLVNNRADFTTLTIDGKTKTVLQLSGTPTAGTSVVTLIAAGSGNAKTTTFTLTVSEGLKSNNVTFGEVGLVAVGEVVKVPVTVTDLAGNEITDVSVLNGASKGVTVTGATYGSFAKDAGKVVYQFTATAEGPQTLTALSKNNKVAIKTIDIKAEAKPAVIVGLDSDVNTLIFKGQTLTLTDDKLRVEDQYGRTMTDAAFAADLDADGVAAANEYRVVVADTADAFITLTGANLDAQAATTVVLNGAQKGSESISFKLQKYVSGTWTDVAASQNTVVFRTVEMSDLSGFGVEDLGKIFDNAAYDKTLSVFGLTSDNKKVALPNTAFTAQASGAVEVVGADVISVVAAPGFTADKKEVEGQVTVTINATGDQFVKAAIATNVAPAVDVIEIRENSAKVTAVSLDAATVGGTFNIADIAAKLYAKDQYGKDATVNASTGVITFADGTTVTPRLTISGLVDGKADVTAPVIGSNGLAAAQITNVGAGDSFNVIVSAGSKSTEIIKVTITN